MTSRVLLPLLLCALVLMLAAYRVPLSGRWVDALVSDRLSAAAGADISVHNTVLRRLSDMRFESLTLRSIGAGRIGRAGAGHIRLDQPLLWFKPVSEARVDLRALDLSAGGLGLLRTAGLPEGPLLIDHLSLIVRQHGATRIVHVTALAADDLSLRGGAAIRRDRLWKLHGLILAPENYWSGLPEQMRERLMRRQSGLRGLRVTLAGHMLALYGRGGPMLQMQWGG